MGKRRVLIFVESGIWLLVAYFEIQGAIEYNSTGLQLYYAPPFSICLWDD
jgi:hypothetical protein